MARHTWAQVGRMVEEQWKVVPIPVLLADTSKKSELRLALDPRSLLPHAFEFHPSQPSRHPFLSDQ